MGTPDEVCVEGIMEHQAGASLRPLRPIDPTNPIIRLYGVSCKHTEFDDGLNFFSNRFD